MSSFKRCILVLGLVCAFILVIQCAPHHKHKHHRRRHSTHFGNTTLQTAFKKPKVPVTRRYSTPFSDHLCNNPHIFMKEKRKIVLEYLRQRCQHVLANAKEPQAALMRSRRKSSRAHNRKDEAKSRREYKKITRLLEKSKCQPLKKMVEIEPKKSLKERYLPCMVLAKRCTGCCLSELEHCVATKIRWKKTKVSVLRERRINVIEAKIKSISVLEHLKCECKCKINAGDCGPGQIYEEKNCMCRCPAGSHTMCPQKKVWNESECKCICRNVKECTTGLVFSNDTCSCELQQHYLKEFYDDLS